MSKPNHRFVILSDDDSSSSSSSSHSSSLTDPDAAKTASTAQTGGRKRKRTVVPLRGPSAPKTSAAVDQLQRMMSDARRAQQPPQQQQPPPPPPPTPFAWPESPDWPGVAHIGQRLGVQHITAVDPGEVNMGVWRFELYPVFRATHVQVLNLHALCAERNAQQPQTAVARSSVMRNGDERYGLRAIMVALQWFVRRETAAGGLFDSNMLFIESQEFRRDMKAIETCLWSLFAAGRPEIVVHGEPGGSKLPAQIVSGNSAKACYAGLFPSVAGYQPADEYEAEELDGTPAADNKKKRRVHGFGDVGPGSAATKRQYASNKKNAKLFGPAIASIERIRAAVPMSDANYAALLAHIRQNKTDDIYDAMFIGLYAISTHLYQMWSYRSRAVFRPLAAVSAPPIRKARQFEEIHELMWSLGASEHEKRRVCEALFK